MFLSGPGAYLTRGRRSKRPFFGQKAQLQLQIQVFSVILGQLFPKFHRILTNPGQINGTVRQCHKAPRTTRKDAEVTLKWAYLVNLGIPGGACMSGFRKGEPKTAVFSQKNSYFFLVSSNSPQIWCPTSHPVPHPPHQFLG